MHIEHVNLTRVVILAMMVLMQQSIPRVIQPVHPMHYCRDALLLQCRAPMVDVKLQQHWLDVVCAPWRVVAFQSAVFPTMQYDANQRDARHSQLGLHALTQTSEAVMNHQALDSSELVVVVAFQLVSSIPQLSILIYEDKLDPMHCID